MKLGALGPYLEIWGPKLDEELATAFSIDDESRQNSLAGMRAGSPACLGHELSLRRCRLLRRLDHEGHSPAGGSVEHHADMRRRP